MSALSYMQRRVSGTYLFRRRLPEVLSGEPVPPHMRDAFNELINTQTGRFKRELVRSLETKDVRAAKRLDYKEAGRVARLFEAACDALRSGTASSGLTASDLQELEAEVLAELLSVDEAERTDGDDRRRFQTVDDRKKWPDLVPAVNLPAGYPRTSTALLDPATKGMTPDHHHAYGELLGELEGEYRDAWSRSDPTIVHAETRIALKGRGAAIYDSSPEFRNAALAVLKAHVRAYELCRQRQQGRIIDTPALTRHDRGPRLSEAFDRWKAGGTALGAKRPNAKTVSEAAQAIRYLRQLHGDMAIGEITREKARMFRDAVAKVPRALPKKLGELPLPVLLQHDLSQFQARSATTVNKLLGLVGAIISQAERDGSLDGVPGFHNPFGKSVRFSVELDDPRAAFDKADLRAILTSPVYSHHMRSRGGGGEAAFWFPLIGLLAGMRLDEIAQMRVRDLRQDEESGRWFFDIGRDGGRSTKTTSSIRRVPVHLELERIGLLRYRQILLDFGIDLESPLWPEVGSQSNRSRSAAWSKWFGRYLRKTVCITDRAKVFHSFRHTFKRMTRDAGLPEEMHDALTGHAGRGGVGRSYGKGYSLAPLFAAMDTVAVPLDLKGIEWAASETK